jgi:hypothetical protein
MTQTTGTAVAVRDRKAAKDAPAEKLALPETLMVPAVLLLAAEVVTGGSDDEERPWLQGVFLHSKDGRGRVAGTDGKRMFVGSFPLPDAPPAWLTEGVILSNDGMRARVGMIAKTNGDSPAVHVSYAKGLAKATMADASGDMQFLTPLCTGVFPDYERVIGMQSFSAMDAEGKYAGREWKPVGINSVYLKQCGDIAKLLDGALPKEKRSKEGMIIRAFNGNGESDAPLVFDFSTWPGAILVIMPTKLANEAMHSETALLLTPALRGTIGALRGQVTRHLMRAQEAATTAERDEAQAQVADFQARIAELLKRVPNAAELEAPEPDLAKVAARRVKRLAKRRARARGQA